VCINGKAKLVPCPEGFGFDKESEDCKPAIEVGCLAAPTTTPKPNGPISCPPSGQSLYPNPDSCESFYVCHSGALDLITCPVGYEFEPNTGHCEEAGLAQCGGTSTSSPPVSCDGKPNGSYMPNPTDCTKFYVCSNGQSVGNTCPPGLQFNAAQSVCDKPETANCHVA